MVLPWSRIGEKASLPDSRESFGAHWEVEWSVRHRRTFPLQVGGAEYRGDQGQYLSKKDIEVLKLLEVVWML